MRLRLQGDAGSGRTIAAVVLAPIVIDNGRQAVIRFDPCVRDRGASGSKRSETAKRLDPHRSSVRGDPQYRAAPGTRTEEARADVVRTLSSVSKGRILLADPKGEECLATPRSGTRLAERRAVCGVRRAAPRGLPGAVPTPLRGLRWTSCARLRQVRDPLSGHLSPEGTDRFDLAGHRVALHYRSAVSGRARTPEPRRHAPMSIVRYPHA